MALITWDNIGEHFYETGVDHGVLYQVDSAGNYGNGVAWNGLTNVSENPSGAEPQKQYADNMPYLTLYSAEEFGLTIEAFTYPDEFGQNNGEIAPISGLKGVRIGQQTRKPFGMCYRSKIGNDVEGDDLGYKLHLAYGLRCSPSERGYATVNDSPEAMSMSWEASSTPVNVAGFKPVSLLTIDSRDFTTTEQKALLTSLEDKLFGKNATTGGSTGTGAVVPYMPLPYEVLTLLGYTPPSS